MQVLSSPDLTPLNLPPSSFMTPTKTKCAVNITASSVVSAPTTRACNIGSAQAWSEVYQHTALRSTLEIHLLAARLAQDLCSCCMASRAESVSQALHPSLSPSCVH